MDKLAGVFFLLVVMLVVALAISFVCALPFMLLWNYAVTHAFGARELGFWHSWCLMVFVSIYLQSTRTKKG